MPEVSIIITAYNDLDKLDKVLEKLKKQTFKDFEVIISDDGSGIHNSEWQDYPFPLKKIWQQDKGMRFCESINNAVKLAKAKWIWFLSADLIPLNDKSLEIYLEHAAETLVLVGGRTSDGWEGEMNFDQVPDANLFFCKETAIKARLWNEEMTGYGFEDYEMMCRMKVFCGCTFLRLRDCECYHEPHPQKDASPKNAAIYQGTLKTLKQ